MCGIFGISQSNLNLNNFDNILRDITNQERLKSLGLKSKIIWECETKNIEKLREKLIHIMD